MATAIRTRARVHASLVSGDHADLSTSSESDSPMSETEFPNLHVVDHPLVQHKLSHLRDQTTWTPLFRTLLREIALLIGYEITRGLPMESRTIETPLTEMEAPFLRGHKPAIVPILRAGLGMAEGLAELLPTAPLGHIGLYRDPNTHRPVEYYVRLPSDTNRLFILVDPMLATGYSASYAVDLLEPQRHRRRQHPLHGHGGRARGDARLQREARERGGVGRLARRVPEREGLHRAGPGRCRRPALRHRLVRPGALLAGVEKGRDPPAEGLAGQLLGDRDRAAQAAHVDAGLEARLAPA